MFDTPDSLPKPESHRCAIRQLTIALSVCVCLTQWLLTPRLLTPLDAAPPAPMRYRIGLEDGSRVAAQRITAWEPAPPSLTLDDRQWIESNPALRWIYDSQSDLDTAPESWIETWSGDRLPGDVLTYSDGQKDTLPQPAHLVISSVTPTRPPRQLDRAQVRVRTACVRRVVWQDAGRQYQPGTAWTQDGRRIDFRAIRWSTDAVTLLTSDGRHSLSFREISELNLPLQSPWPALIDELALVAPEGTGQLVQFETSQGVLVTTSWQRQRVLRPQDRTKASNWLQGVHPAWSLDVLWLPGDKIPLRRFFRSNHVPLSRIPPTEVVQRSAIAGQGRPWQRDRNVEGGRLESGPGIFGWGFGVHAHNELHFQLPATATAWSGFVGLDSLAGSGGCVQARLLLASPVLASPVLASPARQTLFETPVIVGSQQVFATGRQSLKKVASPRTLILQVDAVHTNRPAGADPLDIRDSTDWLDPMLYLDQAVLQPLVARQIPSHLFALRDWKWQSSPETQLHFQNIWDELSQDDSRFALGVSVKGSAPLRLVRQQALGKTDRQLVITVSCPRKTNRPVRIQVLAQGTPLASFNVPLLDRQQFELAPQAISLSTIDAAPDTPIEFEIRQLPGTPDGPVLWHAIEFR